MTNLAGLPPLGLKPPKPKPNREHIAKVKALPCVICHAPPPSDAHHCIHDRYGTQRVADECTIPLCKAHHQQGPDAIHNGKESWRAKYGADHEYLPVVRDIIEGEAQ
jgi:hypothetical protein